jgi:hypothetical protein
MTCHVRNAPRRGKHASPFVPAKPERAAPGVVCLPHREDLHFNDDKLSIYLQIEACYDATTAVLVARTEKWRRERDDENVKTRT